MDDRKISSAWPWQKQLNQLVTPVDGATPIDGATPVDGATPRLAIVGVGQELRGDDGAGPAVVRRLKVLLKPADYLLLVDAAHAPENVLGTINRFRPDVVLFVDALRAGQPPGAITWWPATAADAAGGSTHTLPLNLLAKFITTETGAASYVIGIQPATTDFGEGLSPAIEHAVEQVVAELVAYWRRLMAACSAMSTGDVSVVNT